MSPQRDTPLESGTVSFNVESRILRELGERLVKQPEVALVELIKNAYDADATTCNVKYHPPEEIVIEDDGRGMTLHEFKEGWMTVGTSAKEGQRESKRFHRIITGDKGIGRFAVRFLGSQLELKTVALDPVRKLKTLLVASFDWPMFDQSADLNKLEVPYRLEQAPSAQGTGTKLRITRLRPPALGEINFDAVRTASIPVVTPYRSLLKQNRVNKRARIDPGFSLILKPAPEDVGDADVARVVLDHAVVRAVLEVKGNRINLRVSRRGSDEAVLSISDKLVNLAGDVYADIRFFPQRKGVFTHLPVDGRRARSWVKDHSGVAVFDRGFRVLPYGTPSDDWLFLAADTARSERDPRSSIAQKHFSMDEATRKSTQLNYMLRLPYPAQLIGVVQVEGQRAAKSRESRSGLIPAADREGFVDNNAFQQLRDLVRGTVEAIAKVDRELQQEQERLQREEALDALRQQTTTAIEEIEANPHVRPGDKRTIIARLIETQSLAERHEQRTRERESALEVMSLLGVVAGFMTHEFGVALSELKKSRQHLLALRELDEKIETSAALLEKNINSLQEFVRYSQAYIYGAAKRPDKSYPARPRVQQVIRVFGKYAQDRAISISNDVEGDVRSPLVPVALYNGIILNLYTNALKAVTAKTGGGERRISIRAWNEPAWHRLEVADTGVGIPSALRDRVFDPLFSTTVNNRDPLGSGMGLGLALVRRGAESYGGRTAVVEPPNGYSTCVQVSFPREE